MGIARKLRQLSLGLQRNKASMSTRLRSYCRMTGCGQHNCAKLAWDMAEDLVGDADQGLEFDTVCKSLELFKTLYDTHKNSYVLTFSIANEEETLEDLVDKLEGLDEDAVEYSEAVSFLTKLPPRVQETFKILATEWKYEPFVDGLKVIAGLTKIR